MPKRLGARMDQGFGLSPVSKPMRKTANGVYPSKGNGLGEYGSVTFPSVIEAYNRESDYRRWKLGQEYYFGNGRSWADYQIYSLARFVTGAVDGTSKDIVTVFPSGTSPERAWYAAMRTRGSIMFPQPLAAAAISLNTSDPDPNNHTLTYDVTGVLTPAQVGIFSVFIGDQFEDSASGPSYPDDLIPRPVGSIALTLIAANPGSMTLVFDLSKPQGRIERNGRVYWQALGYDPSAPMSWNTASGRHLCSSFKMFCCCPDHLGGALANLEYPEEAGGTAAMREFPLPNANRTVRAPWERQGAGYYRQWRTLPFRIDQRRECKHMHALRWQCGIPWYEPSDYPTQEERDILELAGASEGRYSARIAGEYFALRQMNYDRYAMSLAEVVGLELFPGSDVRDAIRPDPRPLLWNDGEEPLAIWCRQNDWWLRRGSQQIRIFNASSGQFESAVTVGATSYPFIERVEAGTAGAPVIVP